MQEIWDADAVEGYDTPGTSPGTGPEPVNRWRVLHGAIGQWPGASE